MGRDTGLATRGRGRTYVQYVVARRRWHERLLGVQHLLVGVLALRQRVDLAIASLVYLCHRHVHQITRREVVPLLMGR